MIGMSLSCLSSFEVHWADTVLGHYTSHKAMKVSTFESPVIRGFTELTSKTCLSLRHKESSVTPGGQDWQCYQILFQP